MLAEFEAMVDEAIGLKNNNSTKLSYLAFMQALYNEIHPVRYYNRVAKNQQKPDIASTKQVNRYSDAKYSTITMEQLYQAYVNDTSLYLLVKRLSKKIPAKYAILQSYKDFEQQYPKEAPRYKSKFDDVETIEYRNYTAQEAEALKQNNISFSTRYKRRKDGWSHIESIFIPLRAKRFPPDDPRHLSDEEIIAQFNSGKRFDPFANTPKKKRRRRRPQHLRARDKYNISPNLAYKRKKDGWSHAETNYIPRYGKRYKEGRRGYIPDKYLIKIFKQNLDFHEIQASVLNGTKIEDLIPPED